MASRGRALIRTQKRDDKEAETRRKATESDLWSDQVRALTCKIVVQSQACTFECYFLGNGVRKASKPWMVLCIGVCVALDMLMSRKTCKKSLSRKRRLACAHRRQVFIQKQARECLFFTLALSMLAFNCCSPARSLWMKERSLYWWDHVVNRTFIAHDWLENFRMSQATFLYMCNEIQPIAEKEDTQMRTAVPMEQRVALTLWFLATKLRLPHNWPLIRCI